MCLHGCEYVFSLDCRANAFVGWCCQAAGVTFKMNTDVANIAPVRAAGGVTGVTVTAVNNTTGGASTDTFDAVVSALPSTALGRCLPKAAGTAAVLLQHMPRASVAVVNLGYRHDVVPDNVKGFGYLIPSAEVSVGRRACVCEGVGAGVLLDKRGWWLVGTLLWH